MMACLDTKIARRVAGASSAFARFARLPKILMHGQLVGQNVVADLGLSGLMLFCLTSQVKVEPLHP